PVSTGLMGWIIPDVGRLVKRGRLGLTGGRPRRVMADGIAAQGCTSSQRTRLKIRAFLPITINGHGDAGSVIAPYTLGRIRRAMGWLTGIRLVGRRIGGLGFGLHLDTMEEHLAAIEACTGQLSRTCEDLRLFLEDDTQRRGTWPDPDQG